MITTTPTGVTPETLRLYRAHQKLYSRRLADVEGRVESEIRLALGEGSLAGKTVALTAGSRGIANIARIIRAAARTVRSLGGAPFIVPAMGSHGGATAEGQVEVLESLGVTEEFCGCEIRSSMEVVELGRTQSGLAAYLDKNAHSADGIIVINRVKKHTDFRGPIESGLVKMMTIGLGKRRQAELVHSYGAPGLIKYVSEVARVSLASGKVLLGLAIEENGYDETADIIAFRPDDLIEREMALLESVKGRSPSIPFTDLDAFIVDRMGKEISGTGMDTNIIGRMMVPGIPEPEGPKTRTLVLLDLTEASHGNAIGVGLADLISKKLYDKIDFTATYINGLTSGFLDRVKIPVTLPTDHEAISVSLSRLAPERRLSPRVVRIEDTLHVSTLLVSEALLIEARARGIAIEEKPLPLRFNLSGELSAF